MKTNYAAEVDQLFQLGEPKETLVEDWLDYSLMGINKQHVSQLMKLIEENDSSTNPEMWAPVHAWRALGQLKAEESILTLLNAMDTDNDWAMTEIPFVLSFIGEGSIPALKEFISDSSKDPFARSNAAEALEKIAKLFPHRYEECVSIIGDQFNQYQENSLELNSLLIWSLQNIGVGQRYIETIEKAFEEGRVDESVIGDFEDVQIELGLLEERITPKRNYILEKHPELSPFVERLNRRLDLDANENNSPKKIGRNDPCPCGSRKKYKKCCLIKDRENIM
ncbi:MAG: DUF1186 domain-containing protein [SAR324 cluster bacterium]|nr:DUF1186 domain-containing protein [SAR324 cluster bacterium]